GDVDVGGGGDFPCHDSHPGRDERFAGDSRVGIFDEDRVKHRVGDLIRNLVGMSFRHRLGSEYVAMSWHVLGPYSFKLPERRPAGNRASGSSSVRSTASASANRKMSSASSAERAASAASAALRACSVVTWRMSHLINGSAGGATDSVSYPRPSKRNAESGSDAISPQTLAGLPAARAASATSLSRRRTLGSCGVKRSANRALPRSTTSVYCVRSLVPTLRKSLTSASRSASTAAAGVSTMTPSGTVL